MAASVIGGLFVCGSPASAEVGAPVATVQAIAADAQFLEYAPPPAAPGVVCLIDSGVDPNPDTTPILAGSYATHQGTDTSDELSKTSPPREPGHHPDGHGTYMAMIIGAPQNGWGMVGIAPTSVKVFNLKVLGATQTTFSFAEYANSVEHCVGGPVGVSSLSVVNLSLGSKARPGQDESGTLALAVADARSRGLDVVGAAGNDGGAVAFPAAISGVLAVGATDANPASTGVFCASSGRGPQLAVLAPGCGTQSEPGGGGGGIDVAFSDDGTPAWASGSSEASAVVSAALASMRAYDPRLTSTRAEGCLTSTEVNGGNIDVAAAFRACGLESIVSEGLAAYQAVAATPPSHLPIPVGLPPMISNAAPALKVREPPVSWMPRVISARRHDGHVDVVVANVPGGARLRADLLRKVSSGLFRTVASRTFSGRRVTVKTGHWDRLAVVFVRGSRRSRAANVNPDGTLVADKRPSRRRWVVRK